MENEGIVYEGARREASREIPPFPESGKEIVEMVASGLKPGESARFLITEMVTEMEGFTWQMENGIGTLTKL